MMRNAVVALLFAGIAACSTDAQETYDIVILNGRVVDPETEFDAVRNVGIKDGRNITITEENISGADSTEATGDVVAPGLSIRTHIRATSSATHGGQLGVAPEQVFDLRDERIE